MVLLVVWFTGPLLSMMNASLVYLLTIPTNVIFYYALVRIVLLIWDLLKISGPKPN